MYVVKQKFLNSRISMNMSMQNLNCRMTIYHKKKIITFPSHRVSPPHFSRNISFKSQS
jgi:hypothetical protein